MNLTIIKKEVIQDGFLISKEKLVELIKKSSQQHFSINQSADQKLKVVLIKN